MKKRVRIKNWRSYFNTNLTISSKNKKRVGKSCPKYGDIYQVMKLWHIIIFYNNNNILINKTGGP